MKFKIIPIFICIGSILSGCSPSVPKCDDPEVVTLMKKIAMNKVSSQIPSSMASYLKLSVGEVSTISVDAGTGAYNCASQIDVVFTGSKKETKKEVEFTYLVEMDQETKKVKVEVFGL